MDDNFGMIDDGCNFCCVECGELVSDDDLDDSGVCVECKFAKSDGMKFINERGLKDSFDKWLKEYHKKR